MPTTHVYDAVRTPFGRAAGALSLVRPDDLASLVMKATVERTGLDPERIDDVISGTPIKRVKTTATSRASARY